jgi:hypothetical protein
VNNLEQTERVTLESFPPYVGFGNQETKSFSDMEVELMPKRNGCRPEYLRIEVLGHGSTELLYK